MMPSSQLDVDCKLCDKIAAIEFVPPIFRFSKCFFTHGEVEQLAVVAMGRHEFSCLPDTGKLKQEFVRCCNVPGINSVTEEFAQLFYLVACEKKGELDQYIMSWLDKDAATTRVGLVSYRFRQTKA